MEIQCARITELKFNTQCFRGFQAEEVNKGVQATGIWIFVRGNAVALSLVSWTPGRAICDLVAFLGGTPYFHSAPLHLGVL